MLPPRPRTSVDPDDAIRATDDDAAASRLSAINLGYLNDPYTSLLYRPRASLTGGGAGIGNGNGGAGPSTSAAAARKPPLINVGTYLRTQGIDHIVDQFLEAAGEEGGQIVSLGAGSDSRFWKLRSHARSNRVRKYIEIDFPHVTSLKAQRIARSPKLSKLLSPRSDSLPTTSAEAHLEMAPPSGPSIPPKPYSIGKGGTSLLSPIYSLIPLDLRASPAAQLEDEVLPLLDPQLPTLFLAECVFCYMSPKLSEEVVQWFGKTFNRVVGVVYEMCGLNDTFGQVMKRNLASRQLSLPGSESFASPADQAQRFLVDSLGEGKFTRSGAKNLWEVRQGVIPPEELRRIAQLEFLDEVEELKLVLEHYCIAWGSKGPGLEGVGLGI